MINLTDLSPLMQRAIAKGITFMASQSGIPNYYNLHFAKYTKSNRSLHLTYDENKKVIYQPADENHSKTDFYSVDEVLDYVDSELYK